ncbi:MAG: M56 family metallopeptidase [Firmicutes bacterium]|nr:M56 family metallopeptidase [Bacillota bacterium]
MGYELFLVLLNMSLSGALVILAVLVVRLFLRRMPKLISYCLWAVVLFKLLCPVSFSLPVSLPETENGPVVESGIVYYIPKEILYGQPSPTKPDAPAFAEGEENGAFSYGAGSSTQAGEIGNVVLSGGSKGDVSGEGRNLMKAAMAVWGVGVALMLAQGGASVVILKRKLKGARAVCCSFGDGDQITVYEKENLPTPFVLGLFCPKIYLPAGLKESERQYILLHEQIHIRRRDHIVKAVSFLTLCLHWFNPMVWAAFSLSERDMEMSCDEAVLRKLGSGVKSEYSATLLNLAAGRRIIGGTPLAFGEGTPGRRIRNVLKYKKPQVAAVCVGIVVAVAAAVLLLANPRSGNSDGGQEPGNRQENGNEQGSGGDGGPSQGQGGEDAGAGADYTIDGVTGAVLSFEQEPDTAALEENRKLRAMDRGEALTWETLQKLTEVSLPELKDYAGYQGAVWDDMNEYALNRYLIYELRDEEQGQDYQLLVSYMAEDSHINMIYLARESDRAELPLYREDAGWWDADITAFREHIPSLADWLAEYRLPREEMLQADAFSAMVGYDGGQTFQWLGKYYPMAEPGESCPEEWKAAAVIYRMDGENLVFDADGVLTNVMLWSNHSGIETEPVPVEGCEEQAVLFLFACDLFTLPELAEAEEAGTPISEEESTGHFWYVCFGREGASQGYMFGLNMRYFSKEDAIELAQSIRFTEEAWQ